MNMKVSLWFYLVITSISEIQSATTLTTQYLNTVSTQSSTTKQQTETNSTPVETTSSTITTPTITKTTTKYVKKYSFEHVKDSLGPRKVVDIVFLMARNIEVGKRNFYETSRPLTMSLLKNYATVHEDYARVAYVTFANDSSVDYDGISGNEAPIDKCTMFPSINTTSFPLDTVTYKNEQDKSKDGVSEAIKKVNSIFEEGRNKRNGVTQVLFWLTDGEISPKETIDSNVERFAIGVGELQTEISLKGLVENNDNTGSHEAWERFIKDFPPQNKFENPYIIPLLDESCLGLQVPLKNNLNKTNCYCDIDYGVLRMECKEDLVEILDQLDTEKLGYYDYTRKCLTRDELTSLCPNNLCTSNLCRFDGAECSNLDLDCPICLNNPISKKTENGCNCVCRKGYYGPTCEIKEVSCRFSDLCTNNNTCLNEETSFKCNCSAGFTGDFCENRILLSTTLKPVINTDSLNIPASTIAGIVVGAVILSIFLLGLIILIALCLKKHCDNKKKAKKQAEIGVSTGHKGSMSKWSVKNKNNLSVRLSELWKQRSLRGFKANDGMPSVPWKTKGKLSQMDMQNVSQEEAIFENEVIHDNQPVMDNWKMFMANLVEKNTIEKGMIVNIFTKDIVTTDNWEFNWSEVYTLDTIFGTDTNVTVQDEDYFLKAPVEGVASGKSGSQFSDERQTLVAVAKTKKYLIAAIVALSESQDGSECITEVRSIMNHVKAEGY